MQHTAFLRKQRLTFHENPETCSTMRPSSQSAIECIPSERKRSPRHLMQALSIQLDTCFASNSKTATKTIMGFREGLCTQYFQIPFLEYIVCFFGVDWNNLN